MRRKVGNSGFLWPARGMDRHQMVGPLSQYDYRLPSGKWQVGSGREMEMEMMPAVAGCLVLAACCLLLAAFHQAENSVNVNTAQQQKPARRQSRNNA